MYVQLKCLNCDLGWLEPGPKTFRWWSWRLKFGFQFHRPSMWGKRIVQITQQISVDQGILEMEPKTSGCGLSFCWDISVICLTVVSKLATKVFISLYFQTLWPKWLKITQDVGAGDKNYMPRAAVPKVWPAGQMQPASFCRTALYFNNFVWVN